MTLEVWRNSYNAKNEPVKFAGGWVMGDSWKTFDWKHNPHAIIEVRAVPSLGGESFCPIRGGDVYIRHPALKDPDPNVKFYHAATGLPYSPQ